MKLTKFQEYALSKIPDNEWHIPRELFGLRTGIYRREFVAETLFKKGCIEQRINPDDHSIYSSEFYQYKKSESKGGKNG
jgi:hypothetical protein